MCTLHNLMGGLELRLGRLDLLVVVVVALRDNPASPHTKSLPRAFSTNNAGWTLELEEELANQPESTPNKQKRVVCTQTLHMCTMGALVLKLMFCASTQRPKHHLQQRLVQRSAQWRPPPSPMGWL